MQADRNLLTDGRSLRLSLLLILMSGSGCGGSVEPKSTSAAAETEGLVVATTSLPLLEMATRVAGSQVSVISAVPPDQVSRLWKPSSTDIRQLQSVSLILIHGAGYEPWKGRVSLPQSRLVDTASGYYDQLIRIPDLVVHRHGPEGLHSHAGTVWATWLDPELAMSQLRQVGSALEKLLPEQQSEFSRRTAAMQQELQALDAALDALSQENWQESFTVLADGPYYQYLARRLNWQLVSLHWPEPGEPLSDADRQLLLNRKAECRCPLMLMSADRDQAAVEFAESEGLHVVRIDLCERSSGADSDFVTRCRINLDRLAKVVRQHLPQAEDAGS